MAFPQATVAKLPQMGDEPRVRATESTLDVVATVRPQALPPPGIWQHNEPGFPNDQQQYQLSQPSIKAKKGRKRFSVSSSVERFLVRLLNYTDAPIDDIAVGVEKAGGPKRLWVREKLVAITGTTRLSDLRLLKHSTYAKNCKRQQLDALEAWKRQEEAKCKEPEPYIGESPASATSSGQGHLAWPRAPASVIDADFPPQPEGPLSGSLDAESFSQAPPSYDQTTNDSVMGLGKVSSPTPNTTLLTHSLPNLSTTKRTWVDDAEHVPEDEARPYTKRRRFVHALKTSAIAREVGKIRREPSFYMHVAERLSRSAVTIASRLSSPICSTVSSWSWRTTASADALLSTALPKANDRTESCRTAQSEYKQFYHNQTPEMVAGLPTFTRSAVGPRQVSEARSVVSAIMYAKACSMSDEDALKYVQTGLPNHKSAIISYIIESDERGITGLHLAVAYGFPSVCAFLLENGADPKSATRRGSSVSRFAKAAQQLASDIQLYHRILHCRQWVGQGASPPVLDQPKQTKRSPQRRRTPLRTRTNLSLTPIRDASLDHDQMPLNQHDADGTMTQDATTPITRPFPIIGGQPTWKFQHQPQFATVFTNSPTTSFRSHNFPGRSAVVDFAEERVISPYSMLPNVESLVQDPVTGQSQRGLFSETTTSQQCATVPGWPTSTSDNQLGLSTNTTFDARTTAAPGVPNQYDPFTLTEPQSFPTGVVTAAGALEDAFESEQVPERPLYWQPRPVAVSGLQNVNQYDPVLQQYNNQQPGYHVHPQSQGLPVRTFDMYPLSPGLASRPSNHEGLSLLHANFFNESRPFWVNCVHDRPRNYK